MIYLTGNVTVSRLNIISSVWSQLFFNLFKFKGGIYCRHIFKKVLFRLESNTEPSKNLDNYKKVRSIPKSYNRKPRGSKQAATAPENMPNRGAYPN